MYRSILKICFAASLLASTYGSEAEFPGKLFFHSLPEEVQPYYLQYELAKGWEMSIHNETMRRITGEEVILPYGLDIPENLLTKFETLDVPENFTENLFNFVRTELGLDEASIRSLILTRTVCFEGRFCIDMNDIGSICCPF